MHSGCTCAFSKRAPPAAIPSSTGVAYEVPPLTPIASYPRSSDIINTMFGRRFVLMSLLISLWEISFVDSGALRTKLQVWKYVVNVSFYCQIM